MNNFSIDTVIDLIKQSNQIDRFVNLNLTGREFASNFDIARSQSIEMLKELKAYKDAEEKGLLLHLPFDVGSEIYVLTKRLHIKSGKIHSKIEKFTIRKYVYNSLKHFVIVGIRKYGGDVVEEHFFKEEIGKIVFEKYAEAEAALKKMQEGE